MRNNKLTASYMKDLIDYMYKYHISSATIDEKFKLFCRINENSPMYLHFINLNDYNNEKYNDGVFGVNVKEFIENFKKSEYYKKEFYKEGE